MCLFSFYPNNFTENNVDLRQNPDQIIGVEYKHVDHYVLNKCELCTVINYPYWVTSIPRLGNPVENPANSKSL